MSDAQAVGAELHAAIADLYPICRSITGDGVRETLRRLSRVVPLTLHEVASGTRVLDWTVPPEWNVRDAWIADGRGERVVDFRRSNLHVVSYSRPVRMRLPLAELRARCFSLPEYPDWIPYRTSYYREDWGFCLTHRQLAALSDGEYEVCIDATLGPGSLTYGECVLPGRSDDEILVSTHVCHPSLANDNLSGAVVAAFLGRLLAARERRYTYRLLFIPGTIGSITWLARNEARVGRIRHGLVLTCLGDAGAPSYKTSRRGGAEVDRAVRHVLAARGGPHQVLPFSPWGYDERQYCSPGFDLPVGCLMRTPHGRFPEYHTSADDLDFVRPEALADSLALCVEVMDALEGNHTYRNTSPKGEPQLGRRGLYPAVGGVARGDEELALLWVLNLSDGGHSLLDVAERSGLPFASVRRAADRLLASGLLAETEPA
jgi:aminopeptidase-like protein